MKTCTFFGHRDAPAEIKPALRQAVIDLIESEKVDYFLVGHNGGFDRMVLGVLRELCSVYSFRYAVVVERLNCPDVEDWRETLLPEGLETVPPKFAIWHRNKWMVEQAAYVVVYVTRPFGGAARFAQMAKGKKKRVVALAEK